MKVSKWTCGHSLFTFGNDLFSEARARILWGEPSGSVRGFLIDNGIADLAADAAIKEFNAQRNLEIRRIGVKKSLIGAALTIGSGAYFYWGFLHADIDEMDSGSAHGFVTIAIVIAVGGLYGFSKLIDGVWDLLRPQSEKKSISEL
jgi:hypothetical protein